MSEDSKEVIKKHSTSHLVILITREVILQAELAQRGGEDAVIAQIGLGNLMYGTKDATDVKDWRIQRGATKELAILACNELDRRLPTDDDTQRGHFADEK